MATEVQTLIETAAVFRFFQKAEFTGSRVICNPPVMTTDCDVVVHARDVKSARKFLEDRGYSKPPSPLNGHSGYEPPEGKKVRFETYRKGKMNIILTGDRVFFDKFRKATALAKGLNLKEKKQRVDLFRFVLYGDLPG